MNVEGEASTNGPELEWLVDEEDLRTVARSYWQRDDEGWTTKVAEIVEASGWPAGQVARRVRAVVTARLNFAGCSTCGQGPVVSSRAEFDQQRSWRGYARECADCRAEAQRAKAAQAAEEAALATERRERLADAVQEEFALSDRDPLAIEDLSLTDAVILLTLLGRPQDENYVRSVPLRDWAEPFAPSAFKAVDEIRSLWHRNLLIVHPASSAETFGYTESGSLGIFVERASFTAPGEGPTGPVNADLVARLSSALSGSWPDGWADEAIALCRKLCVADALDYLDLGLDDHGFEFTPGQKTRDVLGRAAERWALGSIYNFIWRAVQNAAAYYQRSGVPKRQAANSVVTRIENADSRARAEGWDITVYRRDRRLPLTAVAQTLIVRVLGLPDPMAIAPDLVADACRAKSVALDF